MDFHESFIFHLFIIHIVDIRKSRNKVIVKDGFEILAISTLKKEMGFVFHELRAKTTSTKLTWGNRSRLTARLNF